MSTKLKYAWKVLSNLGDGKLKSAIISGKMSLEYGINKKTIAPADFAPILCFKTRSKARDFARGFFGEDLQVFKCKGEVSEIKKFYLGYHSLLSDIRSLKEYSQIAKKFNFHPPEGTVYFKSIIIIKKD